MSKTIDTDATLTELLENAGFTGEFLDNSRKLFEETLLARVADIEEDLQAQFEVEKERLVEALDECLEQSLHESVDEIRKLMITLAGSIGGPDAAAAFMKKIAALVRDGALSASSSDWASGSEDDSASNRDSIRGGGVSVRKEHVEAVSVFEEVAAGLDADQREEFMTLTEDLSYSTGEAAKLRARLTEVRNQNFADPRTARYADIISRTVRKG